ESWCRERRGDSIHERRQRLSSPAALDTLVFVQPLVTVVTPSFNQGRFIRATIESVLKQDYSRIEYLVMDGGSTDETQSILREYSDRIRWVSEPDRGTPPAMKKGRRSA